jgi:hypothetical protein
MKGEKKMDKLQELLNKTVYIHLYRDDKRTVVPMHCIETGYQKSKPVEARNLSLFEQDNKINELKHRFQALDTYVQGIHQKNPDVPIIVLGSKGQNVKTATPLKIMYEGHKLEPAELFLQEGLLEKILSSNPGLKELELKSNYLINDALMNAIKKY